ncbi:MAG: PspC domain-containing protein [Nanobdellota archaeon]
MFNLFAFSMAMTLSVLASILVLGVWIWAIVDVIKSKKSTNEKIIWILIVVLLNIVGVIIYYIMRENNVKTKNKQLKKSKDNKILAGVCGGLGEYLELDPTVIRLLWVLLTIFSAGTGILLYLVAMLIIPDQPGEKKQGNSAVPIVLAIAGVAVVLILSVTVIAIVAMSQYVGPDGVTKTATISFENEIAEKVTRDFITSHHNYLNYSGENLFCSTIHEIDDPICDRYNDPYGVTIHEPECFRVHCKFDSGLPHVEGFTVEATVLGDRVKRIGFHEVPKQLPSEQAIRTERECSQAGFKVLYPEEKSSSGPLRCNTSDGVINISTDICVDKCGDGTCQGIVCMGTGCPCAEDKNSCPSDCK